LCFRLFAASLQLGLLLVDRVISGVLTALGLVITCLLIALFMATYRGGMSLNWGAIFDWLGLIGVISFIIGFILGFDRTLELLAQLWGTAQDPKPMLRTFLITFLISLWLLSYFFTGNDL
jgi:hypothetical protein